MNISSPTSYESDELLIVVSENKENHGSEDNEDVFKKDLNISHMKSKEIIHKTSYQIPYKILKNYILGRRLGSGAYGEVREAIDIRNLGRKAVKVMERHSLISKPFGRINMINEIRTLKKLNHIHIVKLYEIFIEQSTNKLYLVLDYCMCSIEDILEQSPAKKLSEWQAHLYFTQLIDGLEYMHDHKIVHNDIKPANLLLTVGELLKICDFGTVVFLSTFSQDDSISSNFGTPAFQPPEVTVYPESFYGFSKDVWSCGVTLYYMVYGKLPFEGPDIVALYENIQHKEPEYEEISTDFVSFVKGMLAKSTNSRFNIHSIKNHSWFQKKHLKREAIPLLLPPNSPAGGIVIDSDLQYLLENLPSTFDPDIINVNIKQLDDMFFGNQHNRCSFDCIV